MKAGSFPHRAGAPGRIRQQLAAGLLLLVLLSACTPAAATTQPTAAPSQAPTTLPTRAPAPALKPTPEPLPSGGAALERIAQLGGSITGIAVAGDLAYVGMGPRLAALDISQHEHPWLVMQSEPLQGLVTRLVQLRSGQGHFLLVSAGRTLLVMDIANPGELKPLHRLELEAEISALVVDGRQGVVYAGGSTYQGPGYAGFSAYLSAVGITPGGELNLMDSVALPEHPESLALAEGSLFVGTAGYNGGLFHMPLKNPGELSAPQLVIASTPGHPLTPLHMQVVGKTLYLSYEGVEAYDISDPGQPVRVWGAAAWTGPVYDFILAGDECYLFGWTIHSEYRYGVVTLSQPIREPPIGESASAAAVHNGAFLVAYNDLEIYAGANPQDLQLVGRYLPVVTNALGAVANDEAVYVLDGGAGGGQSSAILWALSLPGLEPAWQVVTETPNGWPGVSPGPGWIALDGDRLYLASLDSVWVYDVSRTRPALLGKAGVVDGKVGAIRAARSGEKRLLAISQVVDEQRLNFLTVYDLTDVQKPLPVGSPLAVGQGDTRDLAWKGSVIYVLLDPGYLSKSDFLYLIGFDGSTLAARNSLQLGDYTGTMAVDDGLICLVGSDAQFTHALLSTLAPEPLQLLSQAGLPGAPPGHGRGVAVTGGRALVVAGRAAGVSGASGAQLHIYDLHDPGGPSLVQSLDIPDSNMNRLSIAVTGAYVVLANGRGGVELLRSGS